MVTEDRIAACTASPVKTPDGVRRTPSAVGIKAIQRCLEEIKQFGLWALNHNHERLAAT
jgi:aspartate aminotransferase-like enzyme